MKKNILALIGFIASLTSILTLGITSFIGLIFSLLGFILAKDFNNDKKKLSLAGIIISAVMMLVFFGLVTSSGTNNGGTSSSNQSSSSGLFETKKVKVIDSTDMTKDLIDNWCKENKITCYFDEEYSDTVESGKMISQSVEKGKSISPSSTIRFTLSKGRQKTAEEIKNEFISTCGEYSYNDVARNPDNFKGKNAKYFGEVVQVSEGILNSVTLRVGVSCTKYQYIDGYSCPDIIYVTYVYKEGEPRILEDDMITLYGTINGLKSYTSVLGANITIPEMTAKYIDINQ